MTKLCCFKHSLPTILTLSNIASTIPNREESVNVTRTKQQHF